MNGLNISEKNGIALLSDKNETIVKILHNGIVTLRDITAGMKVYSIVDEASTEKARLFFREITVKHAAFDWELNIPCGNVISSFHFAGVCIDGNYLIVAAKTGECIIRMLEEFTRIGNEQTNILRAAIKENNRLRQRAERDSLLYDEISRLNNELVNVRRELTKSNVELETLNKTKNRLLGMAAHDLRNPLSTIMSLAEMVLDDTSHLTAEQTEFLRYIYTMSTYMANLVTEILDVSAIESGKVQLRLAVVDMVKLVRENIELNRMIAETKDIRLDFTTALSELKLDLDKSKITQVMNNLVSNSIKYSFPGTKIDIELSEDDDNCICSVSDEGQGIREDELALLFRPFQKTSTTTTAGESRTGLGLYIVKNIITAHGGSIRAESVLGKGSTFTFSLPKAGPP
ncbi:MAG: sensor histidine kinase [Spirochaetota bacterium]